MSDVCLLRSVLLAEAFEAKLVRPLTSAEQDVVYRANGSATMEEVERVLERATDAASAARVLNELRDRLRP